MDVEWASLAARLCARHDDGLARLPSDPDARQKQLVRTANAAAGAGLALRMAGDSEAPAWLRRAASLYRQSHAHAPPESWGRLIGAIKARLLAADIDSARDDARWALGQGAAAAPSPIGRYAACLAHLALGEDAAAAELALPLARERAEVFPPSVAQALSALAEGDAVAFGQALRAVLVSFEEREAFLEDVPVADTVLVLDELAVQRGIAQRLASRLLPDR